MINITLIKNKYFTLRVCCQVRQIIIRTIFITAIGNMHVIFLSLKSLKGNILKSRKIFKKRFINYFIQKNYLKIGEFSTTFKTRVTLIGHVETM